MSKLEVIGTFFIVANVIWIGCWCWLAGATSLSPIQVAICALNGAAVGGMFFTLLK